MPIKEWFYPGRKTGLEFVYAKKQALEIARHAKKPALAVGAPTPATAENGPKAELPSAEQAKPTPAPESVDLHKLAAVRVEAVSPLGVPVPNPPTAEELPQQQPKAPAIVENKEPEIQKPVAPPASPASANTAETIHLKLTKIAGGLPLIALFGTVCLGAGLGMKAVSRAMSRNRQRPNGLGAGLGMKAVSAMSQNRQRPNFPRRTLYR